MLYGAVSLIVSTNFIACNDSKTGKIVIDGKTHTISIKEITYPDGYCNIELKADKEVLQKFEEFNSSPFWLGTISGKEYTSATGKTVLKDGLIFVVEASTKPDKIVVFTSKQESVVEFDEATLQVIPTSSIEEISNLIHSIDPELCKKFDGYQPLTSSQNGAGISFKVISGQSPSNTFGMIEYGDITIKSRQNYANEFTSHFYAVDAENPAKSLNLHLRGGRNFDSTEFFGIVMFDGDADAKYALIIFEGTPPNSVSPDLITSTFFYIVELGDKYTEGESMYTAIKSFCNTPYLTGDIFKDLKTDEQ